MVVLFAQPGGRKKDCMNNVTDFEIENASDLSI
jgi:hypothetical protein